LQSTSESILSRTLNGAVRDTQTVTADGQALRRLTDGVKIRPVKIHADERGSVMEIFDQRWGWHAAPASSFHCCTIRPGFVKGWGLHEEHEDRYFMLQGEMELVLFDPRPSSSTYGEVCKIFMSEYNRCLLNIPTHVWHALHNVGTKDVIIIDMPTAPYDHARPDKYRLPIDTPLIPYSFGSARGW
jgi:dTDP-4-dehydrorhamnose 3,5-epimerase